MLDLLFPRRCVVCGAAGPLACERCLGRLTRIRPPLCDRCGAPTAWPVGRCSECSGRRLAFASARAAVAHDEAARALVSAWKHRSLRRLAQDAAAVVADALEPPDGAVGTSVPADPERALERAHHPAEALARELAARWDLPFEPLLTRRHARPQRGLSRADRRRNVGDDDRDRRPRADASRPRRRRLHHRRDRLRSGLGPPTGGRAARARRHLLESGPRARIRIESAHGVEPEKERLCVFR